MFWDQEGWILDLRERYTHLVKTLWVVSQEILVATIRLWADQCWRFNREENANKDHNNQVKSSGLQRRNQLLAWRLIFTQKITRAAYVMRFRCIQQFTTKRIKGQHVRQEGTISIWLIFQIKQKSLFQRLCQEWYTPLWEEIARHPKHIKLFIYVLIWCMG